MRARREANQERSKRKTLAKARPRALCRESNTEETRAEPRGDVWWSRRWDSVSNGSEALMRQASWASPLAGIKPKRQSKLVCIDDEMYVWSVAADPGRSAGFRDVVEQKP